VLLQGRKNVKYNGLYTKIKINNSFVSISWVSAQGFDDI
jgi:hypothetical protein